MLTNMPETPSNQEYKQQNKPFERTTPIPLDTGTKTNHVTPEGRKKKLHNAF